VKIIEVETLGGGIAKVNIGTGVITIARDRYYQFPEDIQRIVLLHEMAHYVLQTDDEIAADRWACREFIKEGRSPQMAVFALTKILPFTTPEHFERLYYQIDRVRHYDFHYNGNIQALTKQQPYGFLRNYTLSTRS
jgi:hypothetical protein